MTNLHLEKSQDLSRRAVALARHMQRLDPGIYVLTVVKTAQTVMEWHVLEVPARPPMPSGPAGPDKPI